MSTAPGTPTTPVSVERYASVIASPARALPGAYETHFTAIRTKPPAASFEKPARPRLRGAFRSFQLLVTPATSRRWRRRRIEQLFEESTLAVVTLISIFATLKLKPDFRGPLDDVDTFMYPEPTLPTSPARGPKHETWSITQGPRLPPPAPRPRKPCSAAASAEVTLLPRLRPAHHLPASSKPTPRRLREGGTPAPMSARPAKMPAPRGRR
ncbi:hypothetical protein B0H15DRAFT_948109 [Mycena belliarum]|uniref:Uncharacterized protein n=1 Tax=Mycena belliarum TaxID=1033014 RepID=A0AAD6U8Y1_9AGAR|nr:hypothetical protein B0H15DRAFT_948109 [Mycena belliae]